MANSIQRPVRLSTFQIRFVAADEAYDVNALSGEFMKKSDVHYCAEKDAIDMVAHYLKHADECPFKYLLYKTSKELNKKGEPKHVRLVSTIYGDSDTKQVVIDWWPPNFPNGSRPRLDSSAGNKGNGAP